MQFQYGYGNQYEWMAFKLLIDKGLIDADYQEGSLWRYCKDHEIDLRSNMQKGCLKREVLAFGE